MILPTICQYLMYSSVFLLYGLGLNRLVSLRERFPSLLLACVKTLIAAVSTAALSYLVVQRLLVPLRLGELYPFVIVLVYACISIVTEVFISVGMSDSVTELTVPLLSLVLALSEGTGMVQTVVIVCVCVTGFYLLAAVVCALRMRFDSFAPENGSAIYVLLLVSLAVITVALCSWNVSWLSLLARA